MSDPQNPSGGPADDRTDRERAISADFFRWAKGRYTGTRDLEEEVILSQSYEPGERVGPSVNVLNEDGETPLTVSIRSGVSEVTDFLIRQDFVDVDLKGPGGKSAMEAAYALNPPLYNRLVATGRGPAVSEDPAGGRRRKRRRTRRAIRRRRMTRRSRVFRG